MMFMKLCKKIEILDQLDHKHPEEYEYPPLLSQDYAIKLQNTIDHCLADISQSESHVSRNL